MTDVHLVPQNTKIYESIVVKRANNSTHNTAIDKSEIKSQINALKLQLKYLEMLKLKHQALAKELNKGPNAHPTENFLREGIRLNEIIQVTKAKLDECKKELILAKEYGLEYGPVKINVSKLQVPHVKQSITIEPKPQVKQSIEPKNFTETPNESTLNAPQIPEHTAAWTLDHLVNHF